jgi:CxxC motif-containing protein (DUF1111 family)
MNLQRSLRGLPFAVASALVVSCSPPPAPPGAEILSSDVLGGPLPGLTAEELARFEAGKAVFSRIFLQEDGLGPTYNENSCNACHSTPSVGGAGGEEYDIHATYQSDDGRCDLLDAHGGSNVRTQVTAAARAAGVGPERTPREANQRGLFTAPPLWGRGLVEAVADGTLLGMEDPDDVDGDGISGKVGRDASGRVGRFRRKADVADLADIAAGGVLVEFGLTTPQHPQEAVFSVAVLPEGADPVPDPEIGQDDIDALADFIRFLAIPERNMPPGVAEQGQVAEGERLFQEVGCAACHVPTLPTGPNPVEALSNRVVPLFSDLLLHDMGAEGANLCSPVATPSEFRTEILLGVALRSGYMHDGTAPTVWEAIAMHGGEGVMSRDAFGALSELERHAVVAFVLSL